MKQETSEDIWREKQDEKPISINGKAFQKFAADDNNNNNNNNNDDDDEDASIVSENNIGRTTKPNGRVKKFNIFDDNKK